MPILYAGGRPVEGETKRDDGGDEKYDEGGVLHGLPGKPEKGLGRKRLDHVRTKELYSSLDVLGAATQSFNRDTL